MSQNKDMSEEQEAVTVVEVPIYLKYNFTAGFMSSTNRTSGAASP